MILFYVPCPSVDVADTMAQQLLSEGLIACANRLAPVTAHFMWEGAVSQETEHPLLLKTVPECADEAARRIAVLHPYDVPAILRWTAEANPDFERWAVGATGERTAAQSD